MPRHRWLLTDDGDYARCLISDETWPPARVLAFAKHLVGLVDPRPVLRWELSSRESEASRYRAVFDAEGLRRFTLSYDGRAQGERRPMHRWYLCHNDQQTNRIETSGGPDTALSTATTRIHVNWNQTVLDWLPSTGEDGTVRYQAVLAEA